MATVIAGINAAFELGPTLDPTGVPLSGANLVADILHHPM
jgi:hypothetical protein